MPDPPLSPTPQRWRSSPDSPHPDFATLLSTFETTSTTDDSKSSGSAWATPRTADSKRSFNNGQEEKTAEIEYKTASEHTEAEADMPDIRTSSPSPQRPIDSKCSEGPLSPLLPPSQTQVSGESASAAVGKAAVAQAHGSNSLRSGLREAPYSSSTFSSSVTPTDLIHPEHTGQSIATIDAAYDGVLSELDALANASASSASQSAISSSQTKGISDPGATTNLYHPVPFRQPMLGLNSTLPETGLFTGELSRLSTVSERTERSSNSSASQLSPVVPGEYRSHTHPQSASAIANRYPLMSSPTKGVTNSETLQATPKKASDLIRMFESKSTPTKGELPPVPQQFAISPSRIFPDRTGPAPPIPPKPDTTSVSLRAELPVGANLQAYSPAPTPPPKISSPLSQVRTMIASWRTRSGSPSPKSGITQEGNLPLLRSGDNGWNVSIRRRKRHQQQQQLRGQQMQEGLAHIMMDEQLTGPHDKVQPRIDIYGINKDHDQSPTRSSSLRSDCKAPSELKQFAGEPIRAGTLYYLNVHDEDMRPDYEWVKADGRLYSEGLELTWIGPKGRATVTLDLEFCDEVASTYSPNNPKAGEDIGALAAKRQGALADSLYPFKLVYDDGVERLACDTARDRVRWVNAIWTVLEHTRTPIANRSMSLRANRSSSDHGSDADGSASTHFSAENYRPHPSPRGSVNPPLYTTDDAVIETSGGLHAPIVQRGSRKLAAQGLERVRSLRRVASEADLKDCANDLPFSAERLPATMTDLSEIPLSTRSVLPPTSQDFIFARDIKPPLNGYEGEAKSTYQTPKEANSTASPATGFHSRNTVSTYRAAPPSEFDHTAQQSPSTFGSLAYPLEFGFASQKIHKPGASIEKILSPSGSSHNAKPETYTPTFQNTNKPFGNSHSEQTAVGLSTPMRTVEPYSPVGDKYPFESSPLPSIPQLAVTGASPNERTAWTVQPPQTTVEYIHDHGVGSVATTQPYRDAVGSLSHEGIGDSPHIVPIDKRSSSSSMQTPRINPVHSTSRSSKSTDSSYQTAPPTLPSRNSQYLTALAGSVSSNSAREDVASAPISPQRYQLHDAPVPTFQGMYPRGSDNVSQGHNQNSGIGLQTPPLPLESSSAYGSTDPSDRHSSYLSRPPTNDYITAASKAHSIPSAVTALRSPSRTPRSSEWASASPYPISHESLSENALSHDTDRLSSRRGSRAWTQISHPDSDDDMLADLERRSSTDSSVSRPKMEGYYLTTAPMPSKTEWAVNTHGDSKTSSEKTPYATAMEHTSYDSAWESVYASAPSRQGQSTYMATAVGATSYHTGASPYSASSHTLSAKLAAPMSAITSAKPISISTASTIPSERIPAPTVPQGSPPSPSIPPSDPTSSSWSSTESSTESITTVKAIQSTDVNRLLNFLQGQEQAKQGQTTRIGNQLDRIERKVYQIAENQSALAARDSPPPLPSKDSDDDSTPPSSPTFSSSSSSSTETARPVTPPPLIIPEVINQQFDDLRNLLGTLIGRQEDLLGRQDMMARELERKRSFDVQLPDRGTGLARLEDLLKRVLNRVGDSDPANEYRPTFEEKKDYLASHFATPTTEGTVEGSMYGGGGSVYSSEFDGPGRRAPANSMSSRYERSHLGPLSNVPESLIEGEIPSPEFDDDFALSGLPPDTPPQEFIPRQPQGRPKFSNTALRQHHQISTSTQPGPQPAPQHSTAQEYREPEYNEEGYEPAAEQAVTEYEPSVQSDPELMPHPAKETTAQQSPDQPPVPFRTEENYQDDYEPYQGETYARGPARQAPPPQQLNLPTPVNSPRNMPPYHAQPGPSMRPPFPPGFGMPPPGPGMVDMPRPSLPRIAGVRDPISTTYFRRGFPPGPMNPMGMFPGPMGIPGPGMGPFMPGLRPGLPGYGGPIGPNVNPSLRRPGFFPPGVTSTTGDYGLPAAAHYRNGNVPGGGPMGPPPPINYGNTTTADTGLGNTTTESTVTTPSALTEEIVTPAASLTHISEPVHVSVTASQPTPSHNASLQNPPIVANSMPSTLYAMGAEPDDELMRVLDNAQTIAVAQGDQQNEMSRYLHGMSDQIADGTLATQNRLADILDDIAVLREQIKPKHVHAHVLPDGTVMLDNGDIIDGIRGVPAPTPPGLPPPPPPPPSATHVEGRILSDGTVMVGGKVVDGIKGAPSAPTPTTPAAALEEDIAKEEVVNMEQDRRLAELQEKVEELMARTAPKETVIYEEEEILSIKADTSSPPANLSSMETPAHSIVPTPLVTPVVNQTYNPTVNGSHERTVIREREIVREGPAGRQKEVIFEEGSRDSGGVPAGTIAGSINNAVAADTAADSAPRVTIAATTADGSVIASMPTGAAISSVPFGSHIGPTQLSTLAQGSLGGTAPILPARMPDPPYADSHIHTRINPRTGKPLTIPHALSAQSMSPIQTEHDFGDQPSHLVREEHEEIISRPTVNGPPIVTHNTSRSYTQRPAGPMLSGDGFVGEPKSVAGSVAYSSGHGHLPAGAPSAVFADPARPVTGINTLPAFSEDRLSTAAHIEDHYSNHENIMAQPQPAIPHQSAMHETRTVTPRPTPADVRGTSLQHTSQPLAPIGNSAPSDGAPSHVSGGFPANSAAGHVPSQVGMRPTPSSAADSPHVAHTVNNAPNEKKPADAWDTNHPRPGNPTELSNLPITDTVAKDHSTSNGAHDSHIDPEGARLTELDPPVPTAATDGSKKSGVHWDPRIPTKEVPLHQDRSLELSSDNPPRATDFANVPSGSNASPSGGAADKAPAFLGDAGASSAHAAQPGPDQTPGLHRAHPSGILRRHKSKESVRPSRDPKSVDHPPTMAELAEEGRDLTAQPGGQTIHVPTHPTSASPNKLKKTISSFTEGNMADPQIVANNVPSESALTSQAASRAPSVHSAMPPHESLQASTHQPAVLEEVLLPDGRTAYIERNTPSTAGASAAPLPFGALSVRSLAPASDHPDSPSLSPPPPGARPPSTLKKISSPSTSDETEHTNVSVAPKPLTDGATSRAPTESELGKGHCSVCCPHGARLPTGIPIEACAHQNGALGEAVPGTSNKPAAPSGPRSQKSIDRFNRSPSIHGIPTPEGSIIGEEELPLEEGAIPAEGSTRSGPMVPSNKLTKGRKPPSLTPEEAMEDARKLAVKQKAAAEQAVSEKAEREAKAAEKEAKRRLADERHRQNMEALANLQKILDALAEEHQAEKATEGEKSKEQEERRGDKAARDKKITEALDKLVAERDEAKKKAAADDKKPGTQAILDALKTAGDGQAAFLKKLAADIMEQNSNQHQLTQQAAQASAREQVGFNLAGYLDDFSKALSGEVRVLLKEVGDLRESRRALYMELAELLLMKGRQSAGDLMAILPYPVNPPKNPVAEKKEEKKPPAQPKPPAGVPAWAGWAPPLPPMVGTRPLPQPGAINMGGGAVPAPPPPTGGRPLPQV